MLHMDHLRAITEQTKLGHAIQPSPSPYHSKRKKKQEGIAVESPTIPCASFGEPKSPEPSSWPPDIVRLPGAAPPSHARARRLAWLLGFARREGGVAAAARRGDGGEGEGEVMEDGMGLGSFLSEADRWGPHTELDRT